jgi:hypothetical protein
VCNRAALPSTREALLDIDVGKCDIRVVTSNVGGGPPVPGSTFFPTVVPTVVPTVPTAPATPATVSLAQRVSAIPGLTRASLQQLDRSALQQTLLELCAALGGRTPAEVAAGELHENGTPRVSSLVAVWLLGRVSEAYGSPGRKLVKLSQVRDVDVLRSIGGVTGLLIRAIRRDMGEDSDE